MEGLTCEALLLDELTRDARRERAEVVSSLIAAPFHALLLRPTSGRSRVRLHVTEMNLPARGLAGEYLKYVYASGMLRARS
jgi:hypothetical protein